MYLNELYLYNFKSFKGLQKITFNRNKNILVGNNGVGKTTVIQALRLILKGSSFEYNGVSYLAKLINAEIQKNYDIGTQSLDELPSFQLALTFKTESDDELVPSLRKFEGETIIGGKKLEGKMGISFSYEFNSDYEDEFTLYQKTKNNDEKLLIPYDLYHVKHNLFGGGTYTARMDPMKSVFIDNDRFNGDPYNMFARQMYYTLDKKEQLLAKFSFRDKNNDLFSEINQKINGYNLEVNTDGLRFESLLGIKNDKQVAIEEEGSGKENLIKTKIALDKSIETKLVVIEEPENHLTASSTREQLANIEKNSDDVQIIMTTHDSHIVSRLSVRNLLWLKDFENRKSIYKFQDLDESTLEYFNKRDDLDFLRILTAKKVILVEGAAEYILMPMFLKKLNVKNDIEVLSMNGRYYQPFVKLGEEVGNKILVFTDNDGEFERLQEIKEFNGENVRVYTDLNLLNYTFEVSEYEKNKTLICEEPFSTKANVENKVSGHTYDKYVSYMLNNKTKVALKMQERFARIDSQYKIPDYIVEGIKWLIV